VSFAEGVCANSDGEFTSDGSGDFAALPLLCVVDKRMLEDQTVFGRSGSGFDGAE
jgi:hypothetical protein